METKAREENIIKYYNVLKDLHTILDNTSRMSMLDFSVKNNVSKNLSTVLQKGGVIRKTKSGRYPEWEWSSIKPNRDMAIRTLQGLGTLNPPREDNKPSKRGGKREGSGRKKKSIENIYLDSITFKIIWITVKINLNYKTIK